MTRKCLFFVIGLFIRVVTVYSSQGHGHLLVNGHYDALINVSVAQRNIDNIKNQYDGISDKAKKCDFGLDCIDKSFRNNSESYYYSILDEASERRWAFPIALSCVLEHRAFDCSGCKISLSDSLFGSGIRIRDIFLLSRLSDDDKLHIHPRGSVPTLAQFGHLRQDQYLALLAPVKIDFSANQQGVDLSFSGMYRFRPFSGRNLFGVVGFNIPVGFYTRTLDLLFQDGTLFHTGYTPNVTVRENTITQFFKDFSGVEDFFLRAVLGAKGIQLDQSQQKVGIGDISLFTIAEFGPYYKEFDNGFCIGIDSAQIGFNIAFPTATTSTGIKLWEVEFGNGGGYLLSLFGNMNIRTKADFLNPTINAGVEWSTSFCSGKGGGGIRIPKVVTQTEEIKVGTNPEIITPVYKEYYSDPFVEIDSTIPFFADTLVKNATIKRGRRFFVGIGDYIYNLFKTNFRLGIFYTYSSKKGDKICAGEGFDTSSLSCNCSSHQIGWNLNYQFKNFVETGLGSQHIFAGKGVPEQHEIFVSLSVSF